MDDYRCETGNALGESGTSYARKQGAIKCPRVRVKITKEKWGFAPKYFQWPKMETLNIKKNNNYNILKYIKYVRNLWAHIDILKQTKKVTGYLYLFIYF